MEKQGCQTTFPLPFKPDRVNDVTVTMQKKGIDSLGEQGEENSEDGIELDDKGEKKEGK